MSAEGNSVEFEPLPMKRRTIAGADASQYFVWGEAGESKEIKADTAYEAFRKSGFKVAVKIERMFSSRQALVDRSKLVIATLTDEQQQAEENDSLYDRIRRRKNPIISPDELDELMRSLSKDAAPEEMPDVPKTVEAAPASLIMEPPPVPQPEPSSQSAGVPSPVGLDVHGDGFDEIIPASPSAKAAPLKHAHEAKDAQVVPAEPMPASTAPSLPEKELTAEEVEKLLGGKPE